MNTSYNILIACGGTGGHLFPGIAVAQQLRERGHKPTLLISNKSVDQEGIKAYPELDYVAIPAIAKPPTLSLKMPVFAAKMLNTYIQCARIINQRAIHAALGRGGFTSLAPIIAASRQKLPCFVHDSNALPGKANRLTARWCRRVLLGLADAQSYFPSKPCDITGTPARAEFTTTEASQADARRALELPEQGRVILVLGGSQGAQALNEHILRAAALDPQTHYRLITGRAHEESLKAQLASQYSHANNVSLRGFCSQMALAYRACDGVISRAGASTLTELSLMGKASLLIPYPAAADDHQSYNARAYSTRGAAQLCQQSALSAASILAFTQDIIAHDEQRSAMEQAMKSLSIPDAATRIAEVLLHAIHPY